MNNPKTTEKNQMPQGSSSSTSLEAPKSVPKVIIRFTAIGDAPILKQSFFKISATQRFHSVMFFLRRELRLKKDGSLFLYVNQAFAPNPDEKLGNLFDCFGSEGHLIVNYCTTPAWG